MHLEKALRNNWVDFGDYPDCDPDYDAAPIRISQISMKLLPEVCIGY